jgi:CHAD domain-containing protein
MQAARLQLSISGIIIGGIERIADQRIDRIETLNNSNKKEVLIHDIRTAIKQFRALWRLLRPVIPLEVYERNNTDLRSAGRRLSATRDLEASRSTVVKLLKQKKSLKDRSRLETVLKGLIIQKNFQPIPENGGELNKAIGVLKESRNNFSSLSLDKDGWIALEPGLRETYGRARTEMKRAHKTQDDEYLHSWRKISKYLWYQLQFLEQIRPDGLEKIVRNLKKLGQQLGNYHDNATLINRLSTTPDFFGGNKVVDPVIDLLYENNEMIKRASFKTGKKIFSNKPKEFRPVRMEDEKNHKDTKNTKARK